MEKSRRPVTPSWWTKRTMNLIRTWSPSFNSLSARIETSTPTYYQLWLRILPTTSYKTSKYTMMLGTNVWSLLFPPRASWTLLSNWGGLHLLPVRRIFACCKYQRSPYCQYLLNHHHQDHISYLDYFALSLIGFLCQLMSLVSSKIPESSSSPVR